MEDAHLPLTQSASYAVVGNLQWPTATFIHIEDYATGAEARAALPTSGPVVVREDGSAYTTSKSEVGSRL